MHAPASLDLERSSWTTVVYLNVVKSIRVLLEALETADISSEEASRLSDAGDSWRHQLANLKLRLSPLVGVETTLASRLSSGGGVAMNGGKGGVFVRRGWQTSLKTGTPIGHVRGHNARAPGKASVSGALAIDDPVARMLEATKVWAPPFFPSI